MYAPKDGTAVTKEHAGDGVVDVLGGKLADICAA